MAISNIKWILVVDYLNLGDFGLVIPHFHLILRN